MGRTMYERERERRNQMGGKWKVGLEGPGVGAFVLRVAVGGYNECRWQGYTAHLLMVLLQRFIYSPSV